MARFIRKSDGSGRLAGSIGSGRDTVPSAAAHAPAGVSGRTRCLRPHVPPLTPFT